MARVETNVHQEPYREPYRGTNGNIQREDYTTRREERQNLELVTGGSTAAALAGVGAAVLGLLALVDVLPVILLAIAVIAGGAALAIEGSALGARYAEVYEHITGSRTEAVELGGGMSSEFIAGLGGITLGILSLVGVAPLPLAAIGVIVLGGGLFFGSGATARLNHLVVASSGGPEFGRQVMAQSIESAAGAQAFVGLGAAALGVLAIIGLAPATLSQIGIIAVGAGVMLSAGAIGGRMMKAFRRK